MQGREHDRFTLREDPDADPIATDAERAARRDHALLNAPVGIFQIQGDGERTFVKDRWCELSGMAKRAGRNKVVAV